MSKVVKSWFVYMLGCADGTFYTGITTDLKRRVDEHNGEIGVNKGAKYTAARRPIKLVYSEKVEDRSEASVREYELKSLSRGEKERLINLNN